MHDENDAPLTAILSLDALLDVQNSVQKLRLVSKKTKLAVESNSSFVISLRITKAGLDGPRVGTVGEKSHSAFEVTMYCGKFHWPLLRIPTQVAQVRGMRQEDPAGFVGCHSYSFWE